MSALPNAINPQQTAAPASLDNFATGGEAYRERAYAAGREFLAAVDAILPIIRAGRLETEQIGMVPDRAVAAMVEAGVFRAVTPLQWGGLEMDPASFFEGIMKIAEADASAAWIGGQLNVHSFEVALMSEQMQADFWATGPDTRASSSYAPVGNVDKVEGGYVLSGTWAFSSGVDHATWAILGGGDRNFVVPNSDFTLNQGSWDVQGLKGTGSKSVTLKEVFVPEYRVHKLMDTYLGTDPGLQTNSRPLYNLSFMGLFNAVMHNSAIGATMGGINTFIDQTKVRFSRQGTGVPVADNPFLHVKLANALTTVTTVRARHLANWRKLFDMACEGIESTPLERLRVRFESTDSAAACFDAFADIWPLAGAGAIASTNPLQQVFRDLMAMRNHGSAAREAAAAMYIKTLFDLPRPPFTEGGGTMRTLAYYK